MFGKVKKCVYDRGFGFISCEGYENLFFHFSALRNAELHDVNPGDECEFEIVDCDKGTVAKNITVALADEGEQEEGVITSVKGTYGFIAPDSDGAESLFYHFSDCRFFVTVEEHENARVTFMRAPSERGGFKAIRVELQPCQHEEN